MPIYIAILLGVVQGLTEFLPVSSSGHLLLTQRLFNLPENMLMFDIILHLATLCAVVIVFRKKIWQLIRNPFCQTNFCIAVTTLLTCTLVVLFKDQIDSTFTYKILPFTFMVTAIVLFATSFINNSKKQTPPKEITFKTSLVTGVAQAIAVIPGISRSGSTIAASLFTGTKREDAAEFAFLISIPIIVASFLFELISKPHAAVTLEPLPLLFGFAAALLSGIVAIKFMLKIVRNIKLYWFSIYLVVLSVVLLLVF